MRLFLAAVPSAGRLVELQTLQDKVLPQRAVGPDRLSWDNKEGRLVTSAGIWKQAAPDQLHLTLQFLGDELNIHQKEEIKVALMATQDRHAPFDMRAAGLGAFPKIDCASVLWAGLESIELRALTDDIAATLASIGISRDRSFMPHITLARSRVPQDARAILGQWEGKKWSEQPWRVEGFTLFESRHVLQGREHHVVENYSLSKKT